MPVDGLAAYQRLIQPQGLHVVVDNLRPFKIKPASLRDGKDIPPREWLYGTMMIRRFVTTVIAPGGVGKTAWSIGAALSLVTGKGHIGDYVHAQTNALMCNLEDPEDEFDRRVSAFVIHHKLDSEDVINRLHIVNGRDRRLVIASLDSDGMTVCYPDKEAMTASIRDLNIGIVFVDPFVNSHELEENSNPHINAAVRAWAEIANETGCAIVLIHHTRKGFIAGDADSGRGAGALIAGSRAAYTLSAMPTEDAKGYGIDPKEARLHIRLDDAKANLAPPSDKARWFHLAGINLGNGTQDYPNGDNVQAIEKWEPPSVWAEQQPADLNRVLDVLAEGPDVGRRYSSHKRGKNNTRWAGDVLIDMLGIEEEQAKKMLKDWLRTGLLVDGEYHDKQDRKNLTGVTVDDDKRPTV